MQITLSSPHFPVPPSSHVVRLHAEQQVSQPYAIAVVLLTQHDHLEAAEAVGARATLTLLAGEGEHLLHGLVASVELLDAWDDYRAHLVRVVPDLWRLSLSKHSRVFVDKTVEEVVASILDDYGVRHAFRLRQGSAQHPRLAHICQYRESDLHFVQRLLEREGTFFYFEHEASDELLVIEDVFASRAHRPISYRYQSTVASPDAVMFDRFITRRTAMAGGVEITGYDPTNPRHAIAERRELGGGPSLVSLFNEASAPAAPHPAGWADMRAERLAAQSQSYEGTGAIYQLTPGMGFELSDHPVSELNQAYVTLGVTTIIVDDDHGPLTERLGLGPAKLESRVAAMPTAVPYRPPAVTPAPRVDGVETAVVESTDTGTYADLDEAGRYLVRMHFDEGHRRDGATGVEPASMRVRMIQPHAGSPEGMHFPLKAGTEVMVVFLGGDPDRPVIAGAIPNAVTQSVVTQANPSQNVIHTAGDNTLVFEDEEGHESITLESPNPKTTVRLGKGAPDGLQLKTDGNLDISVQGNLTEHVEGDVERVIEGSEDNTYVEAVSTSYISAVNENYISAANRNYISAVNENYISAVNSNYLAITNSNYAAASFNFYLALETNTYAAAQVNLCLGAVSDTFVGVVNSNYMAAVNENYLAAVNANYVAAVANFYAAAVSNVYAGVSGNLYAAASNNTYAGVEANLYAGASTNVYAAASMNLFASTAMNVSAAYECDVWGGVKMALWAGANIGIGAGLSVDLLAGTKVSQSDTGKIETNTFTIHN